MPIYKRIFNPNRSANKPKNMVEGNPMNWVIIKATINSEEARPISLPKAKAILTTVSMPSIYSQ